MRIDISNLKIFFYISTGIHSLFLSMVCLLFPDFQINRPRPREIEVSLLSLRVEEKPIIIPLPPSQKRSQIKEGVKKPLQHEKNEEPLLKKELEPESPLPFQTEAKVTPISNPLPLEHGKREIGSKNEEITIEEPLNKAVGISLPSEAESGFKEGENPHLFKGGLFNKESPSVATSPSRGLQGNSLPQNPSSEEPQNLAKLPSPSEGEILFAQPRYAENPKPLYPQEARKKGYEGEVVLKVEVLSNGRVGQVETKRSSGHEVLDRSALHAVKQWKFIPAKKGEEAIPLWVNVPIKFQLR